MEEDGDPVPSPSVGPHLTFSCPELHRFRGGGHWETERVNLHRNVRFKKYKPSSRKRICHPITRQGIGKHGSTTTETSLGPLSFPIPPSPIKAFTQTQKGKHGSHIHTLNQTPGAYEKGSLCPCNNPPSTRPTAIIHMSQ